MKAKLILSAVVLVAASVPVLAQPVGGRWDRPMDQRVGRQSAEPSRKVQVEAFQAPDAASLLGKGQITVVAAEGGEAEWNLPVYEAAVVDQLAKLGYDTATNDAAGGQIAQIDVRHEEVVPEEAKRKPVSGAMEVGMSNRGSYQALALNVDLSKPKKAIVATRMDVRIRDKATDRVLWEGHAEAQTREDDDGLNNGAVAARLASALFARFADAQVVPAN